MKNTLTLNAFIVSFAAIFSQQSAANILVVRGSDSSSSQSKAELQTATTDTLSVSSVSTTPTPTTMVQSKPVKLTQPINSAAPLNKPITHSADFAAPNYATTVSPQNKQLFNSQIPNNSNRPYFKISKKLHYEHCFYTSAQKYGIPVDLLLAIAQTESSFRHDVKGVLGYGADHGVMQINDWWVPRLKKKFGITLNDIYNPCTNIEIASWILAHNFVQYGYSWRAVGAYNAVTESKRVIYIRKVSNNLQRLHAGKL